MNKILLLIIALFFHLICISQELSIKELNVSEIKSVFEKDEESHDIGNGPYILINFEILNNTSSDLHLNTANAELFLKFNNDGRIYEESIMSYFLDDDKEVVIPPNLSKAFSCSTYIFMGTELLKKDKIDYSIDLIKVLPTIQLIYSDSKVLKLASLGVKKVTISNLIVGDEN